MKIGIYTKTEMYGGSEVRAAEMCNALVKYTQHEAFFFTEKNIPRRLEDYLNPNVQLTTNIFSRNQDKIPLLYDLNCLLIVNSDSKQFCTIDFWKYVDLTKMKQMIFLFNFIVSPSRNLHEIEKHCPNIKIITANTKFFKEISEQDRYEFVRHFPRFKLESPINPQDYNTTKAPSNKIRFGQHSKGIKNKWSSEWRILIERCNEKLGDFVAFDFMGMNSQVASEVSHFHNVTIRREDEIKVAKYLTGLDVFTYFPDKSREEVWSRCLAEAMVSATAIITNGRGGNPDQVIHGNNGYICKNVDDFFSSIVNLTLNPDKIKIMAKNSLLLAKNFTSEKVIKKFIEFVEA
tara:strand:+ start:2486 stop:3526 length:1041 start_codon:yes stop_codon:yes gene_type:complete